MRVTSDTSRLIRHVIYVTKTDDVSPPLTPVAKPMNQGKLGSDSNFRLSGLGIG